MGKSDRPFAFFSVDGYGVPATTNCGRFFAYTIHEPEDSLAHGGPRSGQDLGFPEEEPQFLSRPSCCPLEHPEHKFCDVYCADIAIPEDHPLLPLGRKTMVEGRWEGSSKGSHS